jgi:hypothetical protein
MGGTPAALKQDAVAGGNSANKLQSSINPPPALFHRNKERAVNI